MANFQYIETITTSEKILNTLKEKVVTGTNFPSHASETPEMNLWQVHSETTTPEGFIDQLILKGTITINNGATPLTKDFYVKFINHAHVDRSTVSPYLTTPKPYTEHSTLTVQILDDPDTSGSTFGLEGHPVLYQWADEDFTPTDRNKTKPVYMYLNVMNNRLAMVLVADPAVNFKDYRKSFLYVGALKPFKYNLDDVEGNVALTAGALIQEPTNTEIAQAGDPGAGGYYYGEYTSPGNNTIQMLKTKSGIEFQKHYPAFITQAPPKGFAYVDTRPETNLGDTGLELEPQGFQASKWTAKYHLSPVYVVHPYEGYRGQLDNCIAVTNHNILHLDELIIDVEGKPWNQEVYRFFDCNTDQTFMNYSANQRMGVAILKEVRYPSAT